MDKILNALLNLWTKHIVLMNWRRDLCSNHDFIDLMSD